MKTNIVVGTNNDEEIYIQQQTKSWHEQQRVGNRIKYKY